MESNGKKVVTPRVAASQSFTPDEVTALILIFEGLRGGRDVSGILRSKAAQGLQRKALAMQSSIDRARSKQIGGS